MFVPGGIRTGIAALAMTGALAAPGVAFAAQQGGIVERAIHAMQAADQRLDRAQKQLARVDGEAEHAREFEAEADKLLGEAGVKDQRLDQARDELAEAEKSADAARQRMQHAGALIDA